MNNETPVEESNTLLWKRVLARLPVSCQIELNDLLLEGSVEGYKAYEEQGQKYIDYCSASKACIVTVEDVARLIHVLQAASVRLLQAQFLRLGLHNEKESSSSFKELGFIEFTPNNLGYSVLPHPSEEIELDRHLSLDTFNNPIQRLLWPSSQFGPNPKSLRINLENREERDSNDWDSIPRLVDRLLYYYDLNKISYKHLQQISGYFTKCVHYLETFKVYQQVSLRLKFWLDHENTFEDLTVKADHFAAGRPVTQEEYDAVKKVTYKYRSHFWHILRGMNPNFMKNYSAFLDQKGRRKLFDLATPYVYTLPVMGNCIEELEWAIFCIEKQFILFEKLFYESNPLDRIENPAFWSKRRELHNLATNVQNAALESWYTTIIYGLEKQAKGVQSMKTDNIYNQSKISK